MQNVFLFEYIYVFHSFIVLLWVHASVSVYGCQCVHICIRVCASVCICSYVWLFTSFSVCMHVCAYIDVVRTALNSSWYKVVENIFTQSLRASEMQRKVDLFLAEFYQVWIQSFFLLPRPVAIRRLKKQTILLFIHSWRENSWQHSFF